MLNAQGAHRTVFCYNNGAMNLPNRLTLARFVMALGFVALMSLHHYYTFLAAYVVFTAAAITDYYDGKIARARGLITNFGKLLDPVADKVLVVGALIMLQDVPCLWIPGWTVVAIIAREFLITGARALAASDGLVIGANWWGKTKTVSQLVFVFVFLFLAIVAQVWERYEAALAPVTRHLETYVTAVRYASLGAIVLVACITIYSGAQFLYANWRDIQGGGQS